MDEHDADASEKYEADMEGETPIPSAVPPVVPTVNQPKAEFHSKHPHEAKPSKIAQLKAFVKECVRVFKITKKPDREEFITVVKISGVGILAIGAIGFLIGLLGRFFTQ